MNILIPFISSTLYALGGQVNKYFRWLMGIPIALIYIFFFHKPVGVFCILTYLAATNWFPYGENSWLNFLGEKGKFAVCGFVFGLASVPVLGWLGLIQAALGALSFVFIRYLDEKGIISNPLVELLRGFTGTILYIGG